MSFLLAPVLVTSAISFAAITVFLFVESTCLAAEKRKRKSLLLMLGSFFFLSLTYSTLYFSFEITEQIDFAHYEKMVEQALFGD